MEDAERLRLNRSGDPDRVLTRGHGHGISPATERLVRTARGFPEGLIEAWANFYLEFAMSVAARRDGLTQPPGWTALPGVQDGRKGVRFIHAVANSHASDGAWTAI